MARGRRSGIPALKTGTGSPDICKKSLTHFTHIGIPMVCDVCRLFVSFSKSGKKEMILEYNFNINFYNIGDVKLFLPSSKHQQTTAVRRCVQIFGSDHYRRFVIIQP